MHEVFGLFWLFIYIHESIIYLFYDIFIFLVMFTAPSGAEQSEKALKIQRSEHDAFAAYINVEKMFFAQVYNVTTFLYIL